MKKLTRKDNYKRKYILKNETSYFILKNITNNLNFIPKIRWKASLVVSKTFKNSNTQSILNRCIVTSRKKRINKLYSFSRIMFLKFARFGYFHGLKKSTW